MSSWIGERMADEHRRDLASTRTGNRWEADQADPALMGAADTERTGAIVSLRGRDGDAARRAIRPQVGTFLIRMGTRLGGASMRTS
jgi:hypothetical protein